MSVQYWTEGAVSELSVTSISLCIAARYVTGGDRYK